MVSAFSARLYQLVLHRPVGALGPPEPLELGRLSVGHPITPWRRVQQRDPPSTPLQGTQKHRWKPLVMTCYDSQAMRKMSHIYRWCTLYVAFLKWWFVHGYVKEAKGKLNHIALNMCCKPLKTMGNRNLKISSTIPIKIAQSLKMFKVWNLPTANSPFAFSISVWGPLLVVRPLCVMLNGNISKCDSQKVQSPRWFSAPIFSRPIIPIWCHLLKLSRCKSTSIASALAGQPSEHFTPKADSKNFPLSRTSSRPTAEKHLGFHQKAGFLSWFYQKFTSKDWFFASKNVGVFPVFPDSQLGFHQRNTNWKSRRCEKRI